MYNRDRISFLSLSCLCSALSFGGDVPQIPNYVTMVNKNPANPPQMPQINPQYPQNAPSSNGVGSSAASGIVGLLIDAGKPNPPDINKLRNDQYEATFQELLAKYGPTKDLAQFYPEKFDAFGNLIGKNGPVYGFPPQTKWVEAPTQGPVFKTTPAPQVTQTPAPVVNTPTAVPTSTAPISLPPAPAAQVNNQPKLTIHDPSKVPSLKDMAAPRYVPTPQAPDPSLLPPSPQMPEGPGMGEMLKGAGEAAAVIAVMAVTGYAVIKTGEYAWKGTKWLGRKLFGSAEQQVQAEVQKIITEVKKTNPNLVIEHQPAVPAIKPHPNLPPNLKPSENPIKLGKKIYQPLPRPGQGSNPHGYKDQWGHYRDYTPENVAHAIESVEKGIYHGQSPVNGKHIFTYDCPKTGLQKWAEVGNDGGILNCGINEVAHTVCPQTKDFIAPKGFKKPSGKGTGWVDKTLKATVISASSTLIKSAPVAPVAAPLLPTPPRDVTVHDLYAERMIKNHDVAMEQKKIAIIQNKINESSNL